MSLIFSNKQTALQILSDKAAEIAFQCLTTCFNFVMGSVTAYSFLSQQSAMSMRKRPRNTLSELVSLFMMVKYVNNEWCEEKVVSEVLRKYDICMCVCV